MEKLSRRLIVAASIGGGAALIAGNAEASAPGSFDCFNTIDDLRAYTGNATTVLLHGALSAGDGGDGMFTTDGSSGNSSNLDNAGTEVVTTGGLLYKRDISGDIDLAWFGVITAFNDSDVTAAEAASNAVAIDAALAKAAALDKNVIFDGVVRTPNTHNIPFKVSLFGRNKDTSIIKTTSATGNVLVAGPRVSIYKVGFASTVTRAAGAYISSTGGGFLLDDFRMDNAFIGLDVSGSGPERVVRNGRIHGIRSNGYGIYWEGTGTGNSIANLIITEAGNSGARAGINLRQSGDIILHNVSTIECDTGLRIDPGTNQAVRGCKATQCWFDDGGNGLFIRPSGDGEVLRCDFTDCWFGNTDDNGVQIWSPDQVRVDGINFINCETPGVTGIGIRVDGFDNAKDIRIIGGRMAGRTIGIRLNGVNGALVTGARIGDVAGKGPNETGISIVSTSKNVVIQDNDLTLNTGDAIYNTATGTGNVIKNNKGYNPVGVTPVTVGGSPYTHTADASPETIFISDGNVSKIKLNGETIFTETGRSVDLEPDDTVQVTFSSAPKIVKYVR